MSDFSSTRKNSSLQEWGEELELFYRIKGKGFDLTEQDIEEAYYAQKRVDDFYYEQEE